MRAALLLVCLATAAFSQYTVETVAGAGSPGFAGDGSSAFHALLNNPRAVALDSAGRLYIADAGNDRIRRVELDGRISTLPETGAAGLVDVAVDNAGQVYAVTAQGVRVLGPDGWAEAPGGPVDSAAAVTVTPSNSVVVASGPQLQRLSPRETLAQVAAPIVDVVATADGGFYVVADRIYRVAANGEATPVQTDVPVTAETRIAVDASGDLYLSGARIWKITGGRSWVLAGTDTPGYSGDGGAAVLAQVQSPSGLAVDRAGNVYFADTLNHRVRLLRAPFPGSISALFPAPRTTDVWPQNVTLLWTPVPNARSYQVWFGKAADQLELLGSTTETQRALGNLESGSTYYWKVSTQVAPLPPVISPVFSFSTGTITGQPPARPDQPSPGNPAMGLPTDFYATWRGSGAIQYNVFLQPNGGPRTHLGTTLQPGIRIQGLRPHTQYFWQVEAINAFGRTLSERWQFTTGSASGLPYLISTVAGSPLPTGDGGVATESVLRFPRHVATDGLDNVYFIDGGRRVRRIGVDGIVTTLYTATAGDLTGLAVDPLGDVYVSQAETVQRISRSGQRTLIAGQPGRRGFAGETGQASEAQFDGITAIALDRRGVLYIADSGNHRVRSLTGGHIATFAGNGACEEVPQFTSANVPFCAPGALATDAENNVYVHTGGRVVRIPPDGSVEVVADQPAPVAGLAVDAANRLHIMDANSLTIRIPGPDGAATVIAGEPGADGRAFGYFGDGLPATRAKFASPAGIAFDSRGNLLIADAGNHRIRRIDTNGFISTIGGMDTTRGDRSNSTSALLYGPTDVAIDSGGTVYIADSLNHRIRRVSPARYLDTVAGGGSLVEGAAVGANATDFRFDFSAGGAVEVDDRGTVLFGDNKYSAATPSSAVVGIGAGSNITEYIAANVRHVGGIVRLPSGEVYVSDPMEHRIIRLSPDGTASVVAGTGVPGFAGDGGPASIAQVHTPGALSVNRNGDVYVAEFGRIRRITPDGRILTVVHEHANGLAHDRLGTLYFTAGRSVYSMSEDGLIVRLAGRDSAPEGLNEGGAAIDTRLSDPRGIAVSRAGEIVFADAGDSLVRRLTRNIPASVTVLGEQPIVTPSGEPSQIQVQVTGRTGKPVPGVAVQLFITSGVPAPVLLATVMTNESGVATLRSTLGNRTGNIGMRAQVAAVAPVDFVVVRQ